MGAGSAARPLECHDALDLVQSETEPASLRDERKKGHRLGAIQAVARSGAARGREDAGFLVQTERLPTNSTLRRYLTDQQAVSCHGSSVNPDSKGKVKRIRFASCACSWCPWTGWGHGMRVATRHVKVEFCRAQDGESSRAEARLLDASLKRPPCRSRGAARSGASTGREGRSPCARPHRHQSARQSEAHSRAAALLRAPRGDGGTLVGSRGARGGHGGRAHGARPARPPRLPWGQELGGGAQRVPTPSTVTQGLDRQRLRDSRRVGQLPRR